MLSLPPLTLNYEIRSSLNTLPPARHYQRRTNTRHLKPRKVAPANQQTFPTISGHLRSTTTTCFLVGVGLGRCQQVLPSRCFRRALHWRWLQCSTALESVSTFLVYDLCTAQSTNKKSAIKIISGPTKSWPLRYVKSSPGPRSPPNSKHAKQC